MENLEQQMAMIIEQSKIEDLILKKENYTYSFFLSHQILRVIMNIIMLELVLMENVVVIVEQVQILKINNHKKIFGFCFVAQKKDIFFL